MAATHSGVTTEAFEKTVQDWLATAKHPKFKRPYNECIYQPMVELLAYLRVNGFKTFIVSGGGVEFMRPWAENACGIPRVGPVFLYPSATDSLLGSEKWGAGPTPVIAKQSGGLTYGVLANQIWSFAGDEGRDYVSSTFLQPFVSYVTRTKTTFGINAESTYDWHNKQWTVPINLSISQLTKIGNLPVQFAIGGKIYVEGPEGAPDWGLRFTVTPLFPTGGKH